MTNGNGLQEHGSTALPPPREAIVEQGLRIQQSTAAERDELRALLAQAQSDIAAYKVALEAMTMQINQAESRVATLQATTDDAVRRCAERETVLASIMALGRAFAIKHQPHITGDGDHEQTPRSDYDRHLDAAGLPDRYNRGDIG